MQGDTISVYSFIVNYTKPITPAPQLQSLNGKKIEGNNKSKLLKPYNKYYLIVNPKPITVSQW